MTADAMPVSGDEQAIDRRELDGAAGPSTAGSDSGRLRSELGAVAEHVVPFGTRMVAEMGRIADEMGREDAAEQRLLAGFEQAVAQQPDAVARDVDLAPIRAVEPDFDPVAFRTLARETFLKVRDARSRADERSDDGLMSPAVERIVDDEISEDVAAHRRHSPAGLELSETVIVSAGVQEGRERLGVRFVASAERVERDTIDDRIDGDQTRSWGELWQFERDPSVDSTATDQQHMLSSGHDGWLFAHRGWLVTGITRLDDV